MHMWSDVAEVKVDYDPGANASAITFAAFPNVGSLRDIPVFADGELTAILTFVDGKLIQLQLLDAQTQLPAEIMPSRRLPDELLPPE